MLLRLVPALLFALGCAPASSRPAPPDPVDPGSGIASLVADHDAAWNAHDPAALANLFVEDATLVTPDGRVVEGRDALLETFDARGPTKQTTSTVRVDSVRSLVDTVALVSATQTLTGPGVEDLGSARARIVAVATERDGEWRFAVVQVVAP